MEKLGAGREETDEYIRRTIEEGFRRWYGVPRPWMIDCTRNTHGMHIDCQEPLLSQRGIIPQSLMQA